MITISGSDLQSLASIAKLAQMDFYPRPVSLVVIDDRLHCIYRGAYAAGDVSVAVGEGWEDTAMVGAQQFAEMVRLFAPDSQVRLTRDGSSLQLRADDRKAHLQVVPNEVADDPVPPTVEGDRILVAADLLHDEVALAGGFCDSSNPVGVLQGVRIMQRGKSLVFMAHDGRAGIFASHIPCEPQGVPSHDVDITVKADPDLATAIDILTGPDDKVQLSMTVERGANESPTRLHVSGPMGSALISILHGSWPDVSSVTKPIERSPLTISADIIAAVTSSIKTLSADQVVIIHPSSSGITVSTREAEMGTFEVQAGGSVSQPVAFGSEELKRAGKLGTSLNLEVSYGTEPSLVKAGNRRYWIGRRVL